MGYPTGKTAAVALKPGEKLGRLEALGVGQRQ
jgi:hypothetical protein